MTPREVVEDYLLYRAADLTIMRGFDYFLMSDRETETITSYSGFVDRFGADYFDRRRLYTGTSTAYLSPVTIYRAYGTIVLQKGDKPPDNVNAFDARDVRRQLAPRLNLP